MIAESMKELLTANGGTLTASIADSLDNRSVTSNEAGGGQKAERDSRSLGEVHLEPVKWMIRKLIRVESRSEE